MTSFLPIFVFVVGDNGSSSHQQTDKGQPELIVTWGRVNVPDTQNVRSTSHYYTSNISTNKQAIINIVIVQSVSRISNKKIALPANTSLSAPFFGIWNINCLCLVFADHKELIKQQKFKKMKGAGCYFFFLLFRCQSMKVMK
jgi:hypothetical protein